VAHEVASLRTLLEGPEAVYGVRDDRPGCFALEQRRSAPSAPFGVRARYCFDAAIGALTRAEVTYAGGIEERLTVTDLRREVRAADLEP
jgi:hypothetical protein